MASIDSEHAVGEGLAMRQKRIDDVCQNRERSQPYLSWRPINVSQACDRMPLIDAVTSMIPVVSRSQWLQWFQIGHIHDGPASAIPFLRRSLPVDGSLPPIDQIAASISDPLQTVRGGQQFTHFFPRSIEPAVSTDIRLLFEDDTLLAIDKPSPLPMHPCGRFNRNTLGSIVDQVFADQMIAGNSTGLRPVHRLDANTSGVVLYAKTRAAATDLQNQFESRSVGKLYEAMVDRRPKWTESVCVEPISRTAGRGGHRVAAADGLPSETKFRVIDQADSSRTDSVRTDASQAGPGRTKIAAVPKTGRTNQIRIHLWHLGHPICGDPLYLADHEIGNQQTLGPSDPQLCLRAVELTFRHPATGIPVTITA